MNITLKSTTNILAHSFYKEFVYDPATFVGAIPDKPYQDTPEQVNANCEKQRELHRIHLAIIMNQQPVGEILFKKLNHKERSCVFSIHLQNDSVKNQGIRTDAARKRLAYSFEALEMKTVFADALIQTI